MTTGHLIEDNELMKVRKPINQNFGAAGDEKNAMAETLAAVRLQFPYPPKDCEQAMTAVETLEQLINDTQQKIASGITNRVGKRYLQAYQDVKQEFLTYTNISKCLTSAMQLDNTTFADSVTDALNKESTDNSSKTKKDNILIFGAIGLLLVGAIVIILKKKTKA